MLKVHGPLKSSNTLFSYISWDYEAVVGKKTIRIVHPKISNYLSIVTIKVFFLSTKKTIT